MKRRILRDVILASTRDVRPHGWAKHHWRGGSGVTDSAEQISPELILVSPPELANRARKLLSPPDFFAAAKRVNGRASQTIDTVAPRIVELVYVERLPQRRSSLPRVVAAVLALVVIGAAAAFVWRDGAEPSASSQPARD
jgi:hypothetical protein